MYEPNYKKTLDHNYLVFPMPEDMDIDYQLNMISENDIPGLIRMHPRYDQDGPQLYYDISSLQPLKRMYEHHAINDSDIRIIFNGILSVYRILQDYMLDDRHLFLMPEHIYVDAVTLKPSLIFLPFYDRDRNQSLLKLSEFFMEHSAHKDNDTDMLSYRLYHLIRLGSFVMADIQKLLDEPVEVLQEPEHDIPSMSPEVTRSEPLSDETTPPTPAFPLIPLITALAGLIICVIPDSIIRIPRALKPGGFALILTGLVIFVFSRKKSSETFTIDQKKEDFRKPEETGEFDAYFSDTTPSAEDDRDSCYGKTIFIESDPKNIEGILIEKNKKEEYPLTSFPFTIGKLKNRCELELNDRSVSRIHARILKKDDQYYLQDCGSTNGTFLNGMQLQTEETVPIEKDDEIGIGRVRFVLA